MGDVANLTGGPTNVYVDLSGVDTDIGFTKGGVKIEADAKIYDLMTDQLGETPVDGVFNGMSATITLNMAEYSLDNIKRAYPNAVPLQDDTTSSKKAVEFRALAGKLLSAQAKKWTFKPIDPVTGVETTNANLWVTVYKAAPIGPFSVSYGSGEQRVLTVTLRVLPDTSANKYRMIRWGDPTVVDANESGF